MSKDRRQSPRSRRRAFAANPSALMAAERQRGRLPYNLWYVYSPRCKRDLILRSDGELDHFFWLEGDPNVASYELESPEYIINVGDDVHKTRFDALVHLRNGKPQLREVKADDDEARRSQRSEQQAEAQHAAASALGFDYVRVTRKELNAHRQLISNWRRAVACLAAARAHSLAPYRNEIRAAVQRHRRATVAQLLAGTDERREMLYWAALFASMQADELASDLATRPVCVQTQVWLSGADDARP